MKQLKCDYCQVLFEREWIDKKNKYNYCSRKCRYMHQSILNKGKNNPNFKNAIKIYECSQCGKELKDYKNYAKNKKNHFCSIKCKHIYQKNKQTVHNWKECSCGFCKNKRKENVGINNSFYIDGRTALTKSIRSLDEYCIWRKSVFERDNYTCSECYQHGGKLEVHHKYEFYKIFNEFLKEYNQFSPVEDKEILVRLAFKYKSFWDINNGKTLCKDCHLKTFKK